MTGEVVSDSVTLYVYDSIGIKDNTAYYVMNYSSNRYLSLETASDTNLTNVYTRERSASTLSQWKTEKQADGTFQLISVYSPTGKALDKTGTNIDIYDDNDANYQKFTICRINSGVYQGLYYIRYGNYYVAQDTDNNVYLTVSYSPRVVWSFMAVEKMGADLFSFNYSGFNTTDNNILFMLTMANLGYVTHVTNMVNNTASNAYTYLCLYDDVFVSRGHGGAGVISFYDSDGVCTGALAVNSSVCNRYDVGDDRVYINSIEKNGLAALRMVMYIGCSTGADIVVGETTYNLVDSTFEKGAHFVLGTTEPVRIVDSNAFLKGFLTELSENQSNIYTCIQEGIFNAGTVPSESGSYPLYYVGDSCQYLN